MGGFETLTARTHREINEERVKRGMTPVDFGDNTPPDSPSPAASAIRRPCQCGCGSSLPESNSKWKFLKGHKPAHLKYVAKNLHTVNGRVPKVSLPQSDSLAPVIAVLDQQINTLNQRLMKMREAKQVLQGL